MTVETSTEIKKRSIERIYHAHWLWEEVSTPMWKKTIFRDKFLEMAIEFTGDHKLYGKWMMEVIKEWKYSCEHNLSNTTQNRRAWIGHAACALAFGCPEDIVREAWGMLSEGQRINADAMADKAIEQWERIHLCRKES